MIQQLQMYEIFEHNKAAFHARFRDLVGGIVDRTLVRTDYSPAR